MTVNDPKTEWFVKRDWLIDFGHDREWFDFFCRDNARTTETMAHTLFFHMFRTFFA